MRFSKESIKVNYFIATGGFNMKVYMSDEYKLDVRNEMQINQDIEDNTLLEDSLLGECTFIYCSVYSSLITC